MSDNMNQSDIKYILQLLDDGMTSRNWDAIDDATESLREFLDDDDECFERGD
jgi:hypothetical protein